MTMNEIIDWTIINKEWLFSGAGVSFLGALVWWLRKKQQAPSQSIRAGDHSRNVQVGGNIEISSDDTSKPD